jgi:hypothetical protein
VYIDDADHRPRSLFDSNRIEQGQLAVGAAITAIVHVALPLVATGVVALFAVIGFPLGAPEVQTPPPIENVVQARFIQRGEIIDPRHLPDRQVPIQRTDVPDPRHAPSLERDPTKAPPPPDHVRQRDSMDDMMQRLSEDSQIFAEREIARVREGDPDGVEGGERTATEGDLYAGRLSAFFRRGWSVPTTIPEEQLSGLSATVSVEIHDDTTMGEWRLERPSGDADFDESVRAQMTRLVASNPNIPPPPEEVAAQYLGQTRHFRFNGRDAHH